MLCKYTTMAMAVVRLFWLNAWNGVVLALDEQCVRLYWCVLEFEASCYWCSMQYEVLMSPSYMLSKYTTMANVFNDVVLALDEQGVRLYWCVLECEASCYWCSMQHEVVMSPSCDVQIHYNGDALFSLYV